MNPEEGSLRLQLLDRFGLMVHVETQADQRERLRILQTVVEYDAAIEECRKRRERKNLKLPEFFLKEEGKLETRKKHLEQARETYWKLTATIPQELLLACTAITQQFKPEGHRVDYLLALAACAQAARQGDNEVTLAHLRDVAEFVMRHRQRVDENEQAYSWNATQRDLVAGVLGLKPIEQGLGHREDNAG